MEPNPNYVNAPFECSGIYHNTPFIASAREPSIDGDCFSREDTLWIKLPERQPMHFKHGKWVPWLNAPAGWEGLVPNPEYRGELPGEGLDNKPMRFDENHWRFPDC